MSFPELAGHLDANGILTHWPSRKRRAVQLAALRYLATKFELGCSYREREVNEILNLWHAFADPALLRREMYEVGLLSRNLDGSNYQLLSTESAEV